MRGNSKSQSRADNRSAQTSAASRRVADQLPDELEQAALLPQEDGRDLRASKLHQTGKPDVAKLPRASLDGLSEDELIEQSLVENHDAFEALVRRYSPRVFSIIGSFFRRRDMVEDIAQEVFARAYFSLSSFTLGRSFEAWVAKIAVNACYDQLRSQRRRIEYQTSRDADQEDDWLELQMLEVATARQASAERQREAADIAERLLSKLEPEDRLVLVLIDRDGFSIKEVSDMTGWGQSKVKVRAFRARRTLRAAMKRLVLSAERKQGSKK